LPCDSAERQSRQRLGTVDIAIQPRVSPCPPLRPTGRRSLIRSASCQPWPSGVGGPWSSCSRDQGISGANDGRQCPGYARLLHDVARNEFDIVAAWSADRFGRSLQQLLAFLAELKAKGSISTCTSRAPTPARRELAKGRGIHAVAQAVGLAPPRCGLATWRRRPNQPCRRRHVASSIVAPGGPWAGWRAGELGVGPAS
jgi:hypothetical protein